MAKPQEKDLPVTIEIMKVQHQVLGFCLLGTSPLVCNPMSAKARQDLLFPPKKKNRHERETSLKHDPLAEYRRSAYLSKDATSPTLVLALSASFKRAMASAALELPGTNKTQIGRLSWVLDDYVPIFGVQQLWMTTVRSADIKRTPDVRTRAILPQWATKIQVGFVTPQLNKQAVSNLLSAAGVFIGVGDGRPEKGALSYGRFKIVDPDDPQYMAVVASGTRDAQAKAFEQPTYYDTETEELLEWYLAETRRRGFTAA